MKKSLFLKLLIGFLIPTILLPSLLLISYFSLTRSYLINELYGKLQGIGIVIKQVILPILEENNKDKLKDLTQNFSAQIGIRITIIQSDGVVIDDSEKNPNDMENHKDRPEIIQAMQNKIGKSMRYSPTLKRDMLYLALPIRINDNNLYFLRLSMFFSDIDVLFAKIGMNMIWMTVALIVISFIVALLFSRSISNPVKELVNASNQVAEGNFGAKVFLKGNNELKVIADNFNNMVSQIKTLFESLSKQKDWVYTIVESIPIYLFVLDKNRKISVTNESFRKIINIENFDDCYYWNIFRDFEFNELIISVKEKGYATSEIEMFNKIFLCNANLIPSTEDIVVIMSDVTEIRKLEQMKKDFVVNVSHELRTPLTAIYGFVETLLEDETIAGDNKHYLKIIKKHTDRLNNIVNDLLLLSELEEGKKLPLRFEKINLIKIVEDIVKIFEGKAKEKNLELNLNYDENLPEISADPFKIEQIFINLISNAARYTEKGSITISLKNASNNMVEISVSDTGIGIAESEFDRIFERFYVVDKSRSRQTGGTGLGLSIVKHIVLLHNGNINVESNLNIGTTFKITLPIDN